MATTLDQIDLWCATASEHQRLEFKEAKQQFDTKKLHRYCVALANEGGGVLVLGVTDRRPRTVVRTRAFLDVIQTGEELFSVLGFRVDVEEVEHPRGRVVAFHIPSRPRGTAYHLDGTYLMRSGEELRPMSEDRLRSIFSEGRPDWLEEPSRAGLMPDQVVSLLDTQGYFDLLKRSQPTHRAGVLDALVRERLVVASGGTFAIRRIGALLLAKRLDDFPDVARKSARVVVYSGNSKLETKLDQSGVRGYAVGFEGLMRFVTSHLPQQEIIRGALRESVRAVPEVALREVVANALIHQDFEMTGASVMIEVYADRVEVSSPGEPIVPVERFIDDYRSRNERLADVMRRMRICEEKGSGIDRVVHAAEEFRLPAPELRAGRHRTSVILRGPIPFEEMDRAQRVRACFQHCVLRWVTSGPMTNQSLRQRFDLPESKGTIVSQVIAATIDERLIKLDEAVGSSRRFARYIPSWA